jgi:hypothetical protein
MIAEEEQKKFTDLLSASAFVAWLTTNTKKRRFHDYLKFLGLVDKEEELSGEQKNLMIKRADSVAEKILRADKKRKRP